VGCRVNRDQIISYICSRGKHFEWDKNEFEVAIQTIFSEIFIDRKNTKMDLEKIPIHFLLEAERLGCTPEEFVLVITEIFESFFINQKILEEDIDKVFDDLKRNILIKIKTSN